MYMDCGVVAGVMERCPAGTVYTGELPGTEKGSQSGSIQGPGGIFLGMLEGWRGREEEETRIVEH